MPPVPEPKRPGATVWFAILVAVAALAFFGWRQFAPKPAAVVTVSAPAPAPLPTLAADTAVTVPQTNNQPHGVLIQ